MLTLIDTCNIASLPSMKDHQRSPSLNVAQTVLTPFVTTNVKKLRNQVMWLVSMKATLASNWKVRHGWLLLITLGCVSISVVSVKPSVIAGNFGDPDVC